MEIAEIKVVFIQHFLGNHKLEIKVLFVQLLIYDVKPEMELIWQQFGQFV